MAGRVSEEDITIEFKPPTRPVFERPSETDDDLEKAFKRADTPQYKYEGCTDVEEYEGNYVRLVDDLLEESTQKFKKKKDRWYKMAKRLEMEGSQYDVNSAVTRTDIPLVPQAVEEAVALQVESLPRPSASPRQSAQEKFAGALNYFMSEELDSNDFDMVVARAILDAKCFSFGCVKQSVDMDQTGPLGQPGRIIFKNIDPRHVWPDPYAKSWRWEDMRYLVIAEPMDLSDIRELWPGKGHLVGPEGDYTSGRGTKEGIVHETVGDDWVIGKRNRALVKECWLKDDRKVFEPLTRPKRDPETGLDTGEMEEVVGPDGKKLGKWVKKYPNGRLIITANGVLLADQPNPFDHGQPPYSFLLSRVSRELMGYGDLELIGRVEDKINQLHKDGIRNLRVGCNAPWVVDRHAFDSPDKFNMMTNDPGMVLPVTAGARVERLQSSELPQSFFLFLDWLRRQFDDVLGVPGINRGQLEKGAQLSADAVDQLQVSGNARMRLRGRLVENWLKHVGHLLQWNIRQFYPDKLEVELIDPRNGNVIKYSWSQDAAKADYSIQIEAGSSLPGAKQGRQEIGRQLFKDGLIDREYAVAMLDLPGAEPMLQRMKQFEEKLAQLGMMSELKKMRPSSKRSA